MPSKAPINSVKHYVQTSLSAVTAGSIANIVFADSVNVPGTGNAQVKDGSVLKAAYIELWLMQASAAVGSFTFTVMKAPGGLPLPATGDLANINDYENKKNILFTSMGLSPPNDTYPTNVIRQHVLIPKGKQRMGLGDQLIYSIRNNNGADDINYCGFVTYKEYQ